MHFSPTYRESVRLDNGFEVRLRAIQPSDKALLKLWLGGADGSWS